MSSSYTDLTQLAKINDKNARDLGVTDIFNDAPVLRAMAATTASNGTSHKYVKYSGAPTVGFRAINVGRDNSPSTDTLVTAELAILDASFAVDKAVADSYRGGPEGFNAREASRHLKSAFFVAEQSLFASSGISAAFSGLDTVITNYGHAMSVNAAGTTQSTASSVWAIRTGDDEQDAMVVLGNEGVISIDQTVVMRVADATPKYYTAYWTPIQAYVGLQFGGIKSFGRIVNLTADTGKGLTDLLIASLLSKFPAGHGPNMLAMSRRSLYQLQASRTATNSTGAPAPFPTESFGVPIVVTDAIPETETLIAAS